MLRETKRDRGRIEDAIITLREEAKDTKKYTNNNNYALKFVVKNINHFEGNNYTWRRI